LPGALGVFERDGEKVQPKSVLWLSPDSVMRLNPAGGGGYGLPLERDPERVLADVVNGYVSLEAARDIYGVVIYFNGEPDSLVRLPTHYVLDLLATEQLRK